MSPNRRMHTLVLSELDTLAALGILTADQVAQLKERYPTTTWDFMALVRAFTVLGLATAISGLVILVREHLNWWLLSETALAVVGGGLLVLGHLLRHRRALPAFGECAEMAGAMALQGLTVVLANHYSTGSDNWPGLEGLDTLMLVALAYITASRLVLWYACINFFFWFGAQTGYMSGWGCYWLGMTYPVRFLGAGGATLVLSWLHSMLIRGRWAKFGRVYAHFGMLVTNLALWFLALFGYYEKYDSPRSDSSGQRLLYSLLWAVVSAASLFAGARYGLRLLRGYGLTFLIINIYTFYFQFVAAQSGEFWFVHMLAVGGSLLWLGFHLEKKRRIAGDPAGDEPAPPPES
jgi:hypothetical protein